MKRSLFALAIAASLAGTFAATARAGTSVDVQISVGDRYHGGTLAFRSAPEVVLVPDTKVYYVRDRDCDLYRYGSYWYFIEDGYWYRASSWRGPFIHIRTVSVPRSVVYVPTRYRRHWGPPGHAPAHGYWGDRGRRTERRHEWREDRRDDRREARWDERDDNKGSKKGHKH